jgi:hypothetical protein
MVTTFGPVPVGLMINGTVCPRPTVCAEEWYTLLLLAISRGSAYATYPIMVLLFLSKANNLRTYLQRSCFSIFIPFHDLHHLHTLGGTIVGWAVCVHGLAHFSRWALQNNLAFLVTHTTGRSGAVSLLLTPLIVVPMRWAKVRKAMRWEVRKGLHYLSALWAFSILFHAPQQMIAWYIGIPLAIYAADVLFGSLFRTYLVETPTFTRLEGAVQLTFKNPTPDFEKAGYALVNVPWLAKAEWHAFSLFRHPTLPDHSCVCMSVNGDWTRALHEKTRVPTCRPCWISGPFASPYSTAVNYDNLILVASGIGITPALSIINSHKATRRINLIWVCRDPSLLEFYLHNNEFDPHAWTIVFYTGKRQLAVKVQQLPKTVLVLSGRPQLDKVICELISGIENGTGLPEAVVHEAEAHMETMKKLDERMQGLHSDSDPGAQLLRFVLLLTHSLYLYAPSDIAALKEQSKCDGSMHSTLADLTGVVIDAMPELYSTSDVAQLAEVLGGEPVFDSLLVPCQSLDNGDIEGFGRDLLDQLQATAGIGSIKAPSDNMSMRSTLVPDPIDASRRGSLLHSKARLSLISGACASLASSRDAVQMQLSEIDDIIIEEEEEEEEEEGDEETALAGGSQRSNGSPSQSQRSPSNSVMGSGRFRKAPPRKRGLSSAYVTSMRLRSLKRVSTNDSITKVRRNRALSWWLNESSGSFQLSRADTLLTRAKSAFIGAPQQAQGEKPESPAERHRLRTWQILYCGGAQPVVDSLTEISKTYGIKLRVEKFDW